MSTSTSSSFQNKLSQLAAFWKTDSVPFVTAYVTTGLLACLVPAFKYRRSVNAYRNSYYYQYQQQNQSEDNGNGVYDVNNCQWYQWNCTPLYMNENGEYVDQNEQNNNGQNEQYYSTPSWFSGWGNGNGSGDRQSRDGGTSNSAALKFVYGWQTIIFVGLLLAYGGMLVYKTRPSHAGAASSRMALTSLLLVLFIWTNTSFMAMWLLANGSISVEGREIEELGGFYNQFSVMMFLSNFWYTIWGTVFCIVIAARLFRTRNMNSTNGRAASGNSRNKDISPMPGDSMNYLPYSEPSVTVTGVENTNSSQTKSEGFSFF